MAPSNPALPDNHSPIYVISAILTSHSLGGPRTTPGPSPAVIRSTFQKEGLPILTPSRIQALEKLRRVTKLCVTPPNNVPDVLREGPGGGPSHQGKQQWVSDLSQ